MCRGGLYDRNLSIAGHGELTEARPLPDAAIVAPVPATTAPVIPRALALSVEAPATALTASPTPLPLGIGADTAAWISAESAKTELKRMVKTGEGD